MHLGDTNLHPYMGIPKTYAAPTLAPDAVALEVAVPLRTASAPATNPQLAIEQLRGVDVSDMELESDA